MIEEYWAGILAILLFFLIKVVQKYNTDNYGTSWSKLRDNNQFMINWLTRKFKYSRTMFKTDFARINMQVAYRKNTTILFKYKVI